ncbi:MAG TPA: glutathione S-transferase family protein [Chthoniobacteraceae bacterium]|nr:glutathione S-transferase family protein [Chthoniobacteraceae bacterium]
MTAKAQFAREQTATGEFERQEDAFRDLVSRDGSTPFAAAAGRYHLYISLACPWACRTLIVRHLKGLEEAIGVTVVDPVRDDRGWAFRDGAGFSHDPINGFSFLSEAYAASDPAFNDADRVTVPVLWDRETGRIVNNSEDDICRMFNDGFNEFARHPEVDLFPPDLREEMDYWSTLIYEQVNNGVYRAGFATSQAAYEKACRLLFSTLDELDARLSTRRYLMGSRIVETDWRLFCTLVRFDVVYFGHFKCNVRRITDYPHLQGYLLDLYQQPGIAATVDFDHIKRHYYMTHDEINPTRIVPIGPLLDWTRPHGRDRW